MDLDEIQSGGGGFAGALARAGLTVLSWGFAAVGAARRAAYDAGWLRARPLGRRAVSVGNLVAGGTGKTPLVAWLAARARLAGRRPAVLSRGYGPRAEGSALSDEGAVLADLLGDAVPQAEDPDRLRGARALLAAHPEVDLFLLDDAFQHRRAARDADLVLLDAADPFGRGRLLPRGMLREPKAALARADAVVVTRAEAVGPEAIEALRREISRRAPGALLAVARTRPRSWRDAEGRSLPVDALAGEAVLAYAGVGSPASFRRALEAAGVRVAAERWAPDHHRPSDAEVAALAPAARAAGAARVVTTHKDLVKMRGRPGLPPGLVALDVETEVVQGADALLRVALGP